ncbi:MAG: hypothetical protein WB799_22605 [Candidatus Sulfotelmatobacter sp.]|jgi:hypothetical protein
MQRPTLAQAIEKLARLGEQAGISVQDMILILKAGASVETLLDLIGQNLQAQEEGLICPGFDRVNMTSQIGN